jgi:outer membrane protein OmpA-like peptidoglycan-associated protein
LLYVSASLKQGTDGIRQSIENKQLAKQSEDLKQQIKVYETLKQDYMKTQATSDEQANYSELMDKLSLLQDEAKDEKNQLRNKALENEKKEQALNKYQQMIRNIVNSNVIAKARIKSRDTLIVSKDETITEKSNEITGLEQTVTEKTHEIQKEEEHISTLESQLDKHVKQLQNAYKAHKLTQAKFQQEKAALQRDTENKIEALRVQTQQKQAELAAAKGQLDQTNAQLAQTSTQLNQAQGTVAKLGQEKSQLESELQNADAKTQAEVARLKGDFNNQKAKDQAAFENQLAKEKLSGAEKAAREAKFKADAENKAKDLQGQMAALGEKYKASQGELAKATENLNARKNLANKIQKQFAAKGIKAEVDGNNGDVLLSFNGEYFDTGRAELKPGMRSILQQAMPAYSQSLFADPKIAEKIQSVEIVGFASPTYKGKYIDPSSLDPDNQKAVNYNLDLSYQRARSIFNYVFDKNKLAFHNQERLLPLVKVTGRSFLASDKGRDPAAANKTGDFCRQNDCAKLQRVVIKFTLKD